MDSGFALRAPRNDGGLDGAKRLGKYSTLGRACRTTFFKEARIAAVTEFSADCRLFQRNEFLLFRQRDEYLLSLEAKSGTLPSASRFADCASLHPGYEFSPSIAPHMSSVLTNHGQNLTRRDIALGPSGARAVAKACKSALRNRVAGVVHQALVVGDIDFRQQHRSQRLTRLHEMMQIGAGVTAGRRPGALFVEWPWIVGMS